MHGQYNLPESRIFRFSIPANAGASGGLSPPEPPQGALPLDPAGALRRPPARLVTPNHLKITCFNKRKQEPCILVPVYLTKLSAPSNLKPNCAFKMWKWWLPLNWVRPQWGEKNKRKLLYKRSGLYHVIKISTCTCVHIKMMVLIMYKYIEHYVYMFVYMCLHCSVLEVLVVLPGIFGLTFWPELPGQ